jgi:hypothetical protein
MTTEDEGEEPEILTKQDFEALAQFRFGINRYLRFSEETVRRDGLTQNPAAVPTQRRHRRHPLAPTFGRGVGIVRVRWRGRRWVQVCVSFAE